MGPGCQTQGEKGRSGHWAGRGASVVRARQAGRGESWAAAWDVGVGGSGCLRGRAGGPEVYWPRRRGWARTGLRKWAASGKGGRPDWVSCWVGFSLWAGLGLLPFLSLILFLFPLLF